MDQIITSEPLTQTTEHILDKLQISPLLFNFSSSYASAYASVKDNNLTR